MWFVLFLDRIDIYEVIEISINFNFFRAINKEINSNTDEQAILYINIQMMLLSEISVWLHWILLKENKIKF